MSDLIKFYKNVLGSVDCHSDPSLDHTLWLKQKAANGEDKEIPLVVKDNKRLILPTDEAVRAPFDYDKSMFFHPACESLLGGQSTVLNTLLILISTKLYRNVMLLASSIADLHLNEDAKDTLSLAQSELMNLYPLNKTSIKFLSKLSNKCTSFSGDYPLFTIKFHRGGVIDDAKYVRTCAVKLMFMEGDTICGLKPDSPTVEKQIRELLRNLFPDKLEYGTNSQSQPYLTVLLQTWYHLATRLNTIHGILKKHSHANHIETGWYNDIPNINKMFKECLPQVFEGNIGKSPTATPAPKIPEPEPVREQQSSQPAARPKTVNDMFNTSRQPVREVLPPFDNPPPATRPSRPMTVSEYMNNTGVVDSHRQSQTNPYAVNGAGQPQHYGARNVQGHPSPFDSQGRGFDSFQSNRGFGSFSRNSR